MFQRARCHQTPIGFRVSGVGSVDNDPCRNSLRKKKGVKLTWLQGLRHRYGLQFSGTLLLNMKASTLQLS